MDPSRTLTPMLLAASRLHVDKTGASIEMVHILDSLASRIDAVWMGRAR